MENGPNTEKEKELESLVDTSDDSTRLSQLENMDERASETSSPSDTNANIQSVSSRIWKSAELEALRSKAGLVAGALSDFQSADGLVAVETFEYEASGRKFLATKIYLVAENLNVKVEKTADGLDFDIQPLA